MRLTMCIPFFFAATLFAQGAGDPLRNSITDTARKYLGVPYVYGAESPGAFDCSGFVHYVYKSAARLDLPRNSRQQWAAGMPIKLDEALPGDVIVFDTTGAGGPSHVAIFLGGGKLIHAISDGPKTGVVESGLNDRYFGPRIIGYRLFLEPGEAVAAKPSAPVQPTVSAQPKVAEGQAANEASEKAAQAAQEARAAKAAQATVQASPAAEPARPIASALAEATVLAEAAGPRIAQIGFDIPAQKATYTDKIPAATGTGLAFTLRNATGKDGRFVVIFYKANKDFSKSTEIHREVVNLPKGKALEIPPYVFAEAGIYKLIVKDNWNDQLMERIFRVVELKK